MTTVDADKTHRGHAIIEQVHADLKNSALAHLPAGVFATNTTIRRKLITVPARVASAARRLTLHLPTHWPRQTAWTQLFTRIYGPPVPATT